MRYQISMHRGIVVVVYTMILVIMLAIFVAADSFGNANTFLLFTILLIPVVVITTSLLDISPRARVAAYLVTAVASLPIAALGLPGGWGLLFSIGIIFLIWAAWIEWWKENPGR